MPAAAAGCGSAERTARTHDTWYARRFFTIPPVSSANGLSVHVLRMMIGLVVGAVADRLVGAQRNADQAGENDGAQGRHDDQNRLLVRHDTPPHLVDPLCARCRIGPPAAGAEVTKIRSTLLGGLEENSRRAG